jgi:predicted enzyme related to lactoylglutathione lyase
MKNTSGKQTLLRGLALVNFYAADIKAAKKWYSELLGIKPYFERPDSEHPAYIEFRLGDYQHEFGIIDSKYAPKGGAAAAGGPGGAVVYWHIDDVAAILEKAKAMGAKEYEPLTKRGEAGFVTASVVDPFGNILGVMYNPHYLDILGSTKREN